MIILNLDLRAKICEHILLNLIKLLKTPKMNESILKYYNGVRKYMIVWFLIIINSIILLCPEIHNDPLRSWIHLYFAYDIANFSNSITIENLKGMNWLLSKCWSYINFDFDQHILILISSAKFKSLCWNLSSLDFNLKIWPKKIYITYLQ